jgi:catechol 2,3-dioxygenase-like lactoylglutathione lyase family enzyme
MSAERRRHSDDPPRPCAIAHIGVTVPDIAAAVDWYCDVLGFQLIAGIHEAIDDGSPDGDGSADAFGPAFHSCKMAQLASANGVGIELFEFVEPRTVAPEDNFPWQATGFSHICVLDPAIDEMVARIQASGGRLRTSRVREVYAGDRYRWAYCEDPFGNVIEIYTHGHEQVHANRAL